VGKKNWKRERRYDLLKKKGVKVGEGEKLIMDNIPESKVKRLTVTSQRHNRKRKYPKSKLWGRKPDTLGTGA